MSGGRSRKRARGKRQRPTASAPKAARAPALAAAESPFFGSAFIAVVALAALVRLAATWNDLWLDEIWTLKLLGTLHSALGIFTLRHDNNHILNSLIVYALRPIGVDWLYRAPAWLAGIATVVLGGWVASIGDGDGAREDASPRTRALVAAILLAGSYLLVHYASEARGYSLALAFGLFALGTVLRDGPRPMSRRAPLAWASLVLAMLAHALAIHFLTALVAWSAARTLRRGGWRYAARTVAWWYAVPGAAFAVFYLGFLRTMRIGGGPFEGAVVPLARAFGVASGLPAGVPVPVLLAFAIAVTAVGVAWLAMRRSDLWILYAVGVVASPVAVALWHKTELYGERYFIVSVTLWLLLAARLLAWLVTRGPEARALVAAVLAAFLLGNSVWTFRLVRDGRGHFRDALRYMALNTHGEMLRVTSDHDFRNRMVVDYYGPRIDWRVRYVDRGERAVVGTDWYIASLPPPPGGVERVLRDFRGDAYRFETEFPSNPFAGLPWRIYRRARSVGTVPRRDRMPPAKNGETSGTHNPAQVRTGIADLLVPSSQIGGKLAQRE